MPMALSFDTVEEAKAALLAVAVDDYNPFHLILGDGQSLCLLREVEGRLDATDLEPGVHVVTERSLVGTPSARESALRTELASWQHDGPPTDQEIEAILGQHREPPFEGTCVHLPEMGYATRSSSILRRSKRGTVSWRFANGSPCRTAFKPLSDAVCEG